MSVSNAPSFSTQPPEALTVEIVERLTASDNLDDQRKGSDIAEVLRLSQDIWKGRLDILDFAAGENRSLVVDFRMITPGLIWDGGHPIPHDLFHLKVALQHNYPAFQPSFRFEGKVPWSMHVVHKQFIPDVEDLAPEIQAYLRQGHGNCCALRSWSRDVNTHSLAICLQQVSGIVSMDIYRGEAYSLNRQARDHTLRLAAEHRLPLGPPLPYPTEGTAPPPCLDVQTGDSDFEWD